MRLVNRNQMENEPGVELFGTLFSTQQETVLAQNKYLKRLQKRLFEFSLEFISFILQKHRQTYHRVLKIPHGNTHNLSKGLSRRGCVRPKMVECMSLSILHIDIKDDSTLSARFQESIRKHKATLAAIFSGYACSFLQRP